MKNKHFEKKKTNAERTKNQNPNARVNELKARFGMSYNYSFLEMDNLQREFYFELQRREKQKEQ